VTILLGMVWLYDLGSAVLGFVATNPVVTLVAALAVAAVGATRARRLGVAGWARRRPRATLALLILTLAIALPLGWYLASPLVLSASIDEPPPVFAAPGHRASVPPPSVEQTASQGIARSSASPVASAASTSAPIRTPASLVLSGSFHGSDDFHFGRGTARLLEVAPGSFVVRLENFAVRNGPDLYVYLSSSARGDTTDAIELGRLKADTGNQNYDVPAGALRDPAKGASVVIWCKQFSHLFATAPLADRSGAPPADPRLRRLTDRGRTRPDHGTARSPCGERAVSVRAVTDGQRGCPASTAASQSTSSCWSIR
jgi:hypothetical protein